MLKVRIAEMNRNVAKQFGVDLTATAKAAGIPGVISTSNPFGLMGKALSDLSGGQIGQACSGQFFQDITKSVANTRPTASTPSFFLTMRPCYPGPDDWYSHVLPGSTNPIWLATAASATGGYDEQQRHDQCSGPVCPTTPRARSRRWKQVRSGDMLAEPNLTAVQR
jgi:Flp pilus assembly secretin CpaC